MIPDPRPKAAYELSGDWSGSAPGCGLPGMYLVGRGGLALAPKHHGWTQLYEGDAVLLPFGVEHEFASRQGVSGQPFEELLQHAEERDGWYRLGEGRRAAQIHVVALGERTLPRLTGWRSFVVLRRGEQTRSVQHLMDALLLELQPEHRHPSVVTPLARALWIRSLADSLDAHRIDIGMLRVVEAARGAIESIATVDDLAGLAGLSRSRFFERFRASYGEPPMTWLRRARMEHARNLLLRDGLSVAEVADRLGYASESAFRKAFRRITGEPARVTR